MLDATTPLLQSKLQVHLDKFLKEIAEILSRYFAHTPPDVNELPGVQKAVADVLAVCFVRAASQKSIRSVRDKAQKFYGVADDVSDSYSQYLLHQTLQASGDPGRLRVLLEILEESLMRYQALGSGYRISVSMVAAWAVLRVKNQATRPPKSQFIWPSATLILQCLDKALMQRGQTAADYAEGVHALVGLEKTPPLPKDSEDLERKLSSLVAEGDGTGVSHQWFLFRDQLGTTDSSPRAGTILDPDPTIRRDVLSKFVYALTAPRFGGRPPKDPERLERCTQEALHIVPRPMPLDIYHSLIAARARFDENGPEFESGSVLVSLDQTRDVEYTKDPEYLGRKEQALANLHQVWQAASADGGGRDTKLYMLYMEGLGRLGDIDGLRRTWNELVDDQVCKQSYLKEVVDREYWHDRRRVHADILAESASFPPTKILNHMISACFLVPTRGAAIALELFKQASTPDSSVPCNLVTINTVLRHYARMANVPLMNSLMILADKLQFKPDVVTYTTLVQGLLLAGELPKAKDALDTMYSQGIQPSERMCSMLVADLAKRGNRSGLQHAEELLREMRKMGHKPGVVTWTGLISGYFRGGWSRDGWDAVDRMENEERLRLNRVSYNLILRQAGEGKITPGAEPVTSRIFKRMVADGITPNSDTYVIMLGPLLRARLWPSANEVVREMYKQGFKPEKGALISLVKKAKFKRVP